MPVYDPSAEPLDPASVSYEPAKRSGDVGYYYLIDKPKQLVVWVVQPPASPMDPPQGHFALYIGAAADYQPNIEAAA
jgi:hypothetical protein